MALARLRRGSLVVALLSAATFQGAAAQPAPDPVGRQVLAFERQRLDAVLHHDLNALSAMLADDLVYTQAGGARLDKQAYLATVASGAITYTSFDIDKPYVRVSGRAAVTHGLFRYQAAGTAGAPPHSGQTIYTAVYVEDGGRWRLKTWQATESKP